MLYYNVTSATDSRSQGRYLEIKYLFCPEILN